MLALGYERNYLPSSGLIVAASAGIAIGIFILDLSLPPGVAGGVPYVALVLVSLYAPWRHYSFILAAVATVLTILGFLLSPPAGIPWMAVANRLLALFAIWATALLCGRRKRSEEMLLREHLMSDAENAAVLSDGYGQFKSIFERKRAETMRQHLLAAERVHRTVAELEEVQDVDKIVGIIARELRELEVNVAALGINIIDSEAETLSSYDILEGDFSLHTVNPLRHPANQELLKRWHRNETWEREPDEDFREITSNRPSYDPSTIIDVPFSEGTLVIGLNSRPGKNRELIELMRGFCKSLTLWFKRSKDIAARQQAIREREATEEQLRQAQKMEAVGQFTAGIAHNFNNMLQPILTGLQVAEQHVPDRQRPILELAQIATRRSRDIIDQMLSFSRHSDQRDFLPVKIPHVIRETMEICRRTFDHSIKIRTHIEEPVSVILGDSSQLEQVFLNLCINARDAMLEEADRPSLIEISLTQRTVSTAAEGLASEASPGSYLCIGVSDNGRGMDKETKDRVFEPFFTTKETGEGTGLGLSMAYVIVQQHCGWIECQSEVGVGTTFTVMLPSVRRNLDPVVQATDQETFQGTETILLIEDDQPVRESVCYIMEKFGYTVLLAVDGREGLEIFRRHRHEIHLVLLDLSMPQMSGREVLAHLRQQAPKTRVIILTGYKIDPSEYEGIQTAIQKPFEMEEILRQVRRGLDSEIE